jgi:hypothetical protein
LQGVLARGAAEPSAASMPMPDAPASGAKR